MNTIEIQHIEHEGLAQKVCRCPAGRLTIGVGRNLEDKGITEQEALFLLKNDIAECEDDLRSIFTEFDDPDDKPREIVNFISFLADDSRQPAEVNPAMLAGLRSRASWIGGITANGWQASTFAHLKEIGII